MPRVEHRRAVVEDTVKREYLPGEATEGVARRFDLEHRQQVSDSDEVCTLAGLRNPKLLYEQLAVCCECDRAHGREDG